MRLTFRLVAMLLVVVLVVIVLDGFLSVIREHNLFLTKMQESAVLLGETTAPLFREVWLNQGPERALGVIHEVNRSEHNITVRWVSFEAQQADRYSPLIAPERFQKAQQDSQKTLVFETKNAEKMVLYMPVDPKDHDLGWLEMSQSYADANAYIHETIIRTLILSLALVLLAGAMHLFFGTYIVGRPLQQLIEHTRRIGRGDFSPMRHDVGTAELAKLSKSLNETSMLLREANEEVRIQNERRVAAIEQLRHSERLATVGRLASGIAHELGTPLNVIAGRAKMIAGGELTPDESVNSSRIIAEQSDRMTTIIRQLLDFARRRKTERAPVDLCGLIKGTVELLRPMARKTRVTLKSDCAPDVPHVSVDQAQLQQALINVIVNGMQAMPGGGDMSVCLSRRETIPADGNIDNGTTKWAAISVIDQGVGIPREHLQTVFDPFFTTKEVGTGTGLGLSITHGIVTEHQGRIEVESAVGEGTTVTILLPLEEEA